MIYNLGNRAVNNYIISNDDGYILVDTGYESGFRRFKRKLKKHNIDPKDIKILFLTHAHDDHAGFLNEILSLTDAIVILHPKTVEGLKRGQNSFEGGCSSRLAHFFCLILALIGKGEHKYPAISEEYLDRLVTIDSEKFRSMDLPFRVLETPGHTSDHISIIYDGIVFCGDAAMNGVPSIRRTTIWIENLQDFKKSWETMLKSSPETLYPAHGKPFPPSDLEKYLPSLDSVRLYPLKQKNNK
ncbi:MAG: MBL fold metallo-hydrolase [Clostridia bacterium]|nr:MBL fold metallo-hydrolase [Clostridia bacterium]